MGASSSAATVTAFFFLPILTRLYSPSEFGIFILFQTIVSLLGIILIFRLELIIPLQKYNIEIMERFSLSLFIYSAFFVIVAFAILSQSSYQNDIILLIGLREEIYWLITIGIIFSSINAIFTSVLTRKNDFTRLALYNFFFIILPLVIQIGIGSILYPEMGLIYGNLLGQFFVIVAIISLKRKLPKLLPFRQFLKIIFENSVYITHTTTLTILSFIRERSIFFLFSTIGNNDIIGHFSLARRINNLPNTLISGSLRQVYFNIGARAPRSSLKFLVIPTLSIFFASVPAAVFWFQSHSDILITVIFGQSWSQTAQIANVLIYPAALNLFTNWLDRSFDLHAKQRYALYMELIFSLAIIMTLSIVYHLNGQFIYLIGAFSITSSLYYILYMVVLFRIIGLPKKYYLIFFILSAISTLSSILSLIITEVLVSSTFLIIFMHLFFVTIISCLIILFLVSAVNINIPIRK